MITTINEYKQSINESNKPINLNIIGASVTDFNGNDILILHLEAGEIKIFFHVDTIYYNINDHTEVIELNDYEKEQIMDYVSNTIISYDYPIVIQNLENMFFHNINESIKLENNYIDIDKLKEYAKSLKIVCAYEDGNIWVSKDGAKIAVSIGDSNPFDEERLEEFIKMYVIPDYKNHDKVEIEIDNEFSYNNNDEYISI